MKMVRIMVLISGVSLPVCACHEPSMALSCTAKHYQTCVNLANSTGSHVSQYVCAHTVLSLVEVWCLLGPFV